MLPLSVDRGEVKAKLKISFVFSIQKSFMHPSASQRVYISKDQYFESVSKEVWEYRIGAYQVVDKYLKDRKGRKLSLDEINHYMKVAKAIQLTIELQGKVDSVYARVDQLVT